MTKLIKTLAASLAFIALSTQASAASHSAQTTQSVNASHKVATIVKAPTVSKIIIQSADRKANSAVIRNVEFRAPTRTRTVVINSARASHSMPNHFKAN